MKKLAVAVLASALLLGGVVPFADAAKKAKQVVEGSIVVPQNGAAAGPCVYRTQRSIMATTGEPNGVVGYTFDVDPATVGKKFKLTASSGAGFDISFYMDLGDPSDPTAAPTNQGYETAGPGGERGVVPEGLPIAFVCMTDGGRSRYIAGRRNVVI
jgi:hypothetical protein